MAGSIGPGTKMPTLGHITYAELRDHYEVQARGLLEGGVDLFLIETQYDLLGLKAAVNGCKRAMAAAGRQIPIQAQVTIELTGTMLPGTEIGAALAAIDPLRVDIIGLNCATGPGEMGEHLRYLSQHSRMPISALPNAGLPSVVDGAMHYDLTPEGLLEAQTRFITEFGVQVVGGCCGTGVDHIRLLAEHCKDLTPSRPHARPPARCGQHLQLHAVRAGGLGPAHRRAHQRQRLQGVPRGDDRGRLGHHGRRWPRTRSPAAPTSSTSASTTSAATATPTCTRWPAASPPSPPCR